MRRGTQLTGVTSDEAGVEVAMSGPDGADVLWCRYLVACDGAHSTGRKLTGVAFPGRAGTLTAVSADVELAAMSVTVPRSVSHISTLTRTGAGYWIPKVTSAGRAPARAHHLSPRCGAGSAPHRSCHHPQVLGEMIEARRRAFLHLLRERRAARLLRRVENRVRDRRPATLLKEDQRVERFEPVTAPRLGRGRAFVIISLIGSTE